MNIFSVSFVNKAIKTLLLFLIIVNVGAGLFAPLFAVFIVDNILNATLITVGLATTIYALTKSVFQIGIARFLDKKKGERDDFRALLIGGTMGFLYFFAFIFVQDIWQLYTLQFINGIGDGFLMAAYYAIFSHHIDSRSQGFEWSLLSVGGLTLASSIGGLVGGIIAENFGFAWIFILAGSFNFVALIMIAILFPSLLIMRKKEDVDSIEYKKRV